MKYLTTNLISISGLTSLSTVYSDDFEVDNLLSARLKKTCKSVDETLVLDFSLSGPADSVAVGYTNAFTVDIEVNASPVMLDATVLDDETVLSDTGTLDILAQVDLLTMHEHQEIAYRDTRILPKNGWIDLGRVYPGGTYITLTLTTKSNFECYAGSLWAGLAIEARNPSYGATWGIDFNTIRIGPYRRLEDNQKTFTGSWSLKDLDTAIYGLEQMAFYFGDTPFPWLLPRVSGVDVMLYGGISDITHDLDDYGRTVIDITFIGEV